MSAKKHVRQFSRLRQSKGRTSAAGRKKAMQARAQPVRPTHSHRHVLPPGAKFAALSREKTPLCAPRLRIGAGTRFAITLAATKLFGAHALGLNGIMSSALSALQTNTAALRVVSNNISNVNTPDYTRRQVNLQTLAGGNQLAGVDIASVQRVVDQFLSQESLAATSSAARYDAQSNTFDQINALLGSPGDGTALTSKLSNIFTALGQAALSPTTPSSQNNVVGAMENLATSISQMSDSLSGLATTIDSQLSTAVSSANSLVKQIYDLNKLIKLAGSQGDTDTTYLDQRDTAMASVAKLIDLRTVPQNDGTVLVSTQDGISLVGASYANLTYTPGTNGNFTPILVQDTDPQTGQPIGATQSLDPHLTGGAIKGLIEMRDGTLANLRNELGAFAQGVSLAFNRVHNANSAYPPPGSLEGRQTGLLAADALNFTGKTTVAVTNSSGVQQHSIAINFTARTLSVDGGAGVAFANTIGDFTAKLNTALASTGGSASFTDGQLTLNAASGEGVVVSDTDPNNPSSRGGTAFSQFFGLNDLFQSSVPSILSTGVSGTDACGLGANGDISLVVKGPNGEVARSAKVTITTGMTVNQALAAINTAMNGYATLTLNPDGSVSTDVSSGYAGYQLQISGDTTVRGTTGVSLTSLFGIGADQMARQASGFAVNPAIVNDPSLIALAKPDFSTTQLVGAGDSNGLLALQNLATGQQSFERAGALGSQVTTLVNYASAFYQDVATRSASARNNQTTQDDRLTEAKSRLSNNSGVSLDEELSNMMIYQQAYSAGARMLTVVNQLYDTLMQII
jgi:flagellar hook-associated protein 1 FlgK